MRLFVYGTLRSDAPRHGLVQGRARFEGPARAPGRLVDLGEYPALVEPASAGDVVSGELYVLSDADRDALLDSLDRYEGPRFRRERAEVQGPDGPVTAWLYRYRADWTGCRVIPEGEYRRPAPDDPRG